MAGIIVRKTKQDMAESGARENKRAAYRNYLARKMGNPGTMTQPTQLTNRQTGEPL